jgi:hypothetical protein
MLCNFQFKDIYRVTFENIKIDVNDILRSLGVGILTLAILRHEGNRVVDELFSLNPIFVSVLVFLGGTILYQTYRPLFYFGIIIALQDRFTLGDRHNYRTFIKKTWKCSSRKAMSFFYFIKTKQEIKPMLKESSAVHLMYMSAIVFLIYGCARMVSAYDAMMLTDDLTYVYLIATGIVVGFAAFLNDRVIERFEYDQIKMISEPSLQEYWTEFIHQPSIASKPTGEN